MLLPSPSNKTKRNMKKSWEKMVENRSHRMSHSSVAQLPEFSTQPLASGGGSAGASVAVSWHSAVESDIGKGSGTGSSSLSSEATTKIPR